MDEIPQLELIGEVNYKMVYRCASWLDAYTTSEVTEIRIILSTEGGDFYAGLAIYDLLKAFPAKKTIYCAGAVMSAGTIILMAADKRVSLPNTRFMIHYGVDTAESTQAAEENRQGVKWMRDLYTSRCKVTKATVSRWLSKETWFSSKEALDKGIVDEIAPQ